MSTGRHPRRPGAPGKAWTCMRIAGIVLSAIPPLLMLVTGAAASFATRRLTVDFLLPAELAFLTLPGMLFIAVAAAKQHTLSRLSVSLAVITAASFLLCQGVAAASGIASGLRAAQGPAWWLIVAFVVLYDLASLAAPIAGIAAAVSAGKK